MGLPVSLILIAVGAILAFAVHHDPNAAVNVHVVGWVLMGVGLVGLLLALLWWERWGPGYWRRASYAGPPADGTARPYRGRRRTVVDEREGPAPATPPGEPYDAPPPPP